MVSVDCKELVLAHVRNCFVTSDDHGFCELLFSKQLPLEPQGLNSVLNEEFILPLIDTDADDFSRFSPECPYVESHDPRCAASSPECDTTNCTNSIQTSKQSCKLKNLTKTDIDYYFPVSTVVSPPNSTNTSPRKSCLTLALEQAQADGRLARSNLFSDFCVHDGRPTVAVTDYPTSRSDHANLASRRFTVWLWRVSNFPRVALSVQPRVGTTVRQFVGLTFWQYFNQATRSDTPSELFDNLDRFDSTFLDRISVYILDSPEEDVDSEFPPLDSKDPIHKYDFDSLALVEQTATRLQEPTTTEVPKVVVTIHMTQGISTFRFPADTQLSAVLEHAARRRKLPQHDGYQYHLESWPYSTDQRAQPQSQQQNSQTEPQTIFSRKKPGDAATGQLREGQRLDLSVRLSDVVAARLPLRFILLRDHSRCDPALMESGDEDDPAEHTATPSTVGHNPARLHATLQLRQYRVTMLRGVSSREVQLNVSADGIKIEQVVPSFRRPKFFSKPAKPMLFSVDALADCELVQSARTSACDERRDNRSQSTTSSDSQTRGFSTGKVQFRIIYTISCDNNSAHSSTNSGQRSGLDGEPNGIVDPAPLGSQFQSLYFETQWARARAICDQITMILGCYESKARQLYMRQRLAPI